MWEGALIAVFANFLVSLSLIVQKHAHMKNEAETARANAANAKSTNSINPVVASKDYWQLKWWWLGISINAVGELGNLIAYGYAPTIVVAPLGATTVMFNSFFSVLILKERFRPKDIAYLMSILAGIVLIIYSNSADPQPHLTVDETISNYFNTWQSILLFSTSIVCIVVLQLYIKLRGVDSMFPALWNSAIISMYTVLCSKAAIMWMRAPEDGKPTQLPYALLWIMMAFVAITAVWSMHYLQMALQSYEASLTIPTFFTLFTFCCIAGAALAFQEFSALTALPLALFIIGLALAVLGVYLLARRGGSIAETAITQALHHGLVLRPSPALRRCQTSGGRIFAETADVVPTRLVYEQDLQAVKVPPGVSSTGYEDFPGAVQSFAEVLLMQVCLEFAFSAVKLSFWLSRPVSSSQPLRCVLVVFLPRMTLLQENVSKDQIVEHLRCTDSPDLFFSRSSGVSLSDFSNSVTRSSSPMKQVGSMAQEISGLRSPSRLYKVSLLALSSMAARAACFFVHHRALFLRQTSVAGSAVTARSKSFAAIGTATRHEFSSRQSSQDRRWFRVLGPSSFHRYFQETELVSDECQLTRLQQSHRR